MDWNIAALSIIASILVTVMAGLPVAVSLGLVSITFIWAISGPGVVSSTIASSYMDFWSSYSMLALPLFIFMGEYLFAGGVVADLFDFASKWLQRIPGGMAMVAIGTGAMFGTLSGSSLAGIATIGVLSGPEMLKRGYDKRLIGGVICAAGGLAMLIPPSAIAVLYASVAEVSVGRQLMAGFIPGFLLAAIYAVVVFVWVRLTPNAAPPEPPVTWRERFATVKKLVLPAAIAITVLGCIYTGITTATEAAAVGAFLAIGVAIFYRRLGSKKILEIAMSSVRTTCFILLIAVGGKLLSWALTYYLIPQNIIETLGSLEINRYLIIILIQVVLLVMGMFMDAVSIVVVTTPILVPLLTALDFDLIWFGTTMIINLELGLITPPVGLALFVVQGTLPNDLKLGDILKGSLVFGSAQLTLIGLLIAFPIIAMAIPNMM